MSKPVGICKAREARRALYADISATQQCVYEIAIGGMLANDRGDWPLGSHCEFERIQEIIDQQPDGGTFAEAAIKFLQERIKVLEFRNRKPDPAN